MHVMHAAPLRAEAAQTHPKMSMHCVSYFLLCRPGMAQTERQVAWMFYVVKLFPEPPTWLLPPPQHAGPAPA